MSSEPHIFFSDVNERQGSFLRRTMLLGGATVVGGLALVGRLVVSPLVVLLLVPLFPIPELMGKVFIMQASLPVLMQAAILSAYYRTDPEFGALMVSLSTLLSALTIPIYMTLL